MPLRHPSAAFVFEELEARILFSADTSALATILVPEDMAEQGKSFYQAVTSPMESGLDQTLGNSLAESVSGTLRKEIVFIDGAVDGAESLAAQLRAQNGGNASRSLDVFLLDTAVDGVAQITAILSGRQDIDALHIISHGADGQLQLGAARLDQASLIGNALEISAWGEALSGDGDILLYGCDVARTESGQRFVDDLGRLTGADMQASVDLTGSPLVRGNWALEYRFGAIETRVAPSAPVQFSYSGVLASFVVTSAADSGAGSLRQAILDANANGQNDIINFAIGSGQKTIDLVSALPIITTRINIDATTQPGYGGSPLIEINGSATSGSTGFQFNAGASGSALKGLVINRLANGVSLNGVSSVSIVGNYIGLNAAGTAGSANSLAGITLINATNNVIGGSTPALRNVISGNGRHGIDIETGSAGNVVDGNYIGTNALGTEIVANGWSGVSIKASNNTIGVNSGNVISGNAQSGLVLTSASNTVIQKNRIGTNAAGDAALANTDQGIRIEGTTSNNLIGGRAGIEGNLVSGNLEEGITISSASSGNTINGNYLGVNAAGTDAMPNRRTNLYIQGSNNIIGSGTAEYGNVISGSREAGLVISGGANNTVKGNFIGTGANGIGSVGNLLAGVRLENGARNNLIGDTDRTRANMIANNGEAGIVAAGDGTAGNRFYGNSIYDNAGLAIDLGDDGVSANDATDSDSGVNSFQNFPVITEVSRSGNNTRIAFTFNGAASTDYRLEFFASTAPDPSGYGEAQRFVADVTITTDSAGRMDGTFTFIDRPSRYGDYISGTATNEVTGDTSEFSLVSRIPGTNSAPTSANLALAIQEDSPRVLQTSLFSFSDSNSPADAFHSVGIVTLPSSGTLRLNGVVVAAGTFILKSDLDLNRLVYTPAPNATGTVDGLTFRVRDNGGTANGGADTDAVARQMRFVISAINDAPTGTANTVTFVPNGSHMFTRAEFGFADPADNPANGFLSVIVSALPGAGQLQLNGVAVTQDQEIAVGDIDAGRLAYVPAPNTAASTFFQFRVRDNGGTSNGGLDTDPTQRRMSLTPSTDNQAPAGTDTTVTVFEDRDYVFRESDFGFTDPGDFPADTLDRVNFTTLPATGSLLYRGAAFFAGNYISAEDIRDGLLIYRPPANVSGANAASFTFQVQDNGGTSGNGVDTDSTPNTLTVTIAAVNDAPRGANGAVATDSGSPYVFQIADFGFTDTGDTPAHGFYAVIIDSIPAGGTLRNNGVLVAAGDNVLASDIATGKLVFSTGALDYATRIQTFGFRVTDNGGRLDGGQDTDTTSRQMSITVRAHNAPPTGADRAIAMLEDGTHVFQPAEFGYSDAANPAQNTFVAVVITSVPVSGTLRNGATVLTDGSTVSRQDIADGRLTYAAAANANGAGAASFRFQVRDDGGTVNGARDTDPVARTMRFDITAINDAPSGADRAVTVLEDTPFAFSIGDFFLSDTSDSPADSLLSVIFDSLPASGELRIDGALVSVGTQVQAADIAAGRLLYRPANDATGATSFTFRVRDNGGTDNGGRDMAVTPRTMSIAITPVNDAPSGQNRTITVLEDGSRAFTLADFGFGDARDGAGNAFQSVFIITLPAGGALTINNVPVTANQEIGAADISGGRLVYAPAPNAVGTFSFRFQVRDDGGSANGGVDLDPIPRTMGLEITPVNDAPTGAAGAVGTISGTPYVFGLADFGFSDTADSPANRFESVIIATVPLTGTLSVNGTNLVAGATVLAADIAAGRLAYSNDFPVYGDSADTFTFRVVDDGGAANGGSDTDVAARTMTVAVAAQNAPPAGADNTVSLLEDGYHVFSSAEFGFSDSGNTPQNTLLEVRINTPPASGTLSNRGVTLTAGSVVSRADIDAGFLVYTAPANANGPAAASLRFQVRDDGGTASGGMDLDPVARTIFFDIQSVNDAPTGGDNTVFTLEDTAYTFQTTDFRFSDADDAPGNDFLSVHIESLPSGGRLTLYGMDIAAGALVLAGDIANGALVYTPAPDVNGAAAASFGFRVRDNGGTADNGRDMDAVRRTMTIAVAQVNDAPVGTDNGIRLSEGGMHVFTLVDFGFTDPNDRPTNQFSSVIISSVPVYGTLSYRGVPVQAGVAVMRADIEAGNLVYRLAADVNRTDGFRFQVQDDGGMTNGGQDTDGTARTLVISVSRTPGAIPDTIGDATGPDNIQLPRPGVDAAGPGNIQIPERSEDAAGPGNIQIPERNEDAAAPGIIQIPGPSEDVALPGNVQNFYPGAAGTGNGTIGEVAQLGPLQQAEAGQASESRDDEGAGAPARAASGTAGSGGAGQRPGAQAASLAIGTGKPALQVSVEQNRLTGNNAMFSWERSGEPATVEAKRFEPVLGYREEDAAEKPSPASLLLQIELERRTSAALPKNLVSGSANSGIIASSASIDEEEERANHLLSGSGVRMETAAALGAIGTVWVVARKAALVASLLTTVPAWLRLDPLPILSRDPESEPGPDPKDEKGTGKSDRTDSVEHLFSIEEKTAGDREG